MVEPMPRRRRRSRRDADATPAPVEEAAAYTAPEPVDPEEDVAGERGLRGLVGGGASQVNVRAALRARDATRPSAEDLTAAERNLVIIRRGWTPPADPR